MRSMLFVLALVFSCQSFAGFIQFNDTINKIYGFIDDSTGVEWLSLELTVGMSVKEALDLYLDYGLATSVQFDQLYNSVFAGIDLLAIDYRDTFGRDIIINPDNINDSGDERVVRRTCEASESCFPQATLWHSLFLQNSPEGVGHVKYAWGSAFNASGHIRTRGAYLQNSNPTDPKNYAYVYTENFRSSSLINTTSPVAGVGTYLVKLDQPRVLPLSVQNVSEPASLISIMLGLSMLLVRRVLS